MQKALIRLTLDPFLAPLDSPLSICNFSNERL